MLTSALEVETEKSCIQSIAAYSGLAIFAKPILSSIIEPSGMAGLMQDRFREHISVADVLKANYGSTDDIERVEAIHALENEIQQLCCSREADVQATLRGTCPPSCSVVLFQTSPSASRFDIYANNWAIGVLEAGRRGLTFLGGCTLQSSARRQRKSRLS